MSIQFQNLFLFFSPCEPIIPHTTKKAKIRQKTQKNEELCQATLIPLYF